MTAETRRAPMHLVLVLALVLAGCSSVAPLDTALRRPVPSPLIQFGADTFAFANESRSKNQGKPDLFANYCFVMARAVTQFHRFARFDPDAPRLSAQAYTERVAQVTVLAPWDDPLPEDARVVIPGYASLYEFSAAQEPAVKAGLEGRFWTWIHWTNWRVVFPFTGAHQERVASQTLSELQAGRLVQFLVTNFPVWELNHTVVVYDYRIGDNRSVEFVVYDPNDPHAPGVITFDRTERRFMATHLYDTVPGAIRAFRMYYWPLL
ncbi:MAG TPA: hypothetical protein VMS64_28510 [Candidatus Methylomirabilis sp.]|nr:hypothetical protein [Candidatus Methylomirabilis sp.]